PHLTVHRRRGGEMLLRLRAFAGARVELAKAEVAVRFKRAPAQLGFERQRILEMRPGRPDVRGITGGLGFAEGPETCRLVTPLAASVRVRKPGQGGGPRVTHLAGQERRLALQSQKESPADPVLGLALDRGLFQ